MIHSKSLQFESSSRFRQWLMVMMTAAVFCALPLGQAEARRGLFRRGCGHRHCCALRRCCPDDPTRDLYCPHFYGGPEGEEHVYWGKRYYEGLCYKPWVPLRYSEMIPEEELGCDPENGHCMGSRKSRGRDLGYKRDLPTPPWIIANKVGDAITGTFNFKDGTIQLKLYKVQLRNGEHGYVGYERANAEPGDFKMRPETLVCPDGYCGSITLRDDPENPYHVIRMRD